jgi:RNA 2',3'-cyclic 3'-phosphodiesterase
MAILPKQPYSRTQLTDLANSQRAKHGLTGTLLAENRFHITLNALGYDGRPPEDFVQDVGAAAEEAACPVPPFEIKFDRVASFPGSGAYVLLSHSGNDELHQFREGLIIALSSYGVHCDQSKFQPHITLLYDHRIVREEAVEPVSWVVNEFAFVISLAGKTKYLFPKRWKLRG